MSILVEATLAAVFESMIERLQSITPKLLGFGKKHRPTVGEIQKWNSILREFRAFHEDAEQMKFTNFEIKNWIEDMEVLANDMEDALEELEYGSLQTQQRMNFLITKIFKSGSSVEDEVKAITVRIETMNQRKRHLVMGNTLVPHNGPVRKPEGPISAERKLFGRESEKEEIIEILFKPNDGEQRFGIIPIVGMAGIGKTTLAQHVLKDERVVRAFEVRAWSSISFEFDQCRIFKGIIEEVTGSCHVQDPCSIQNKLHRELKDKKFLIILDDVWNESIWVLKEFWAPFLDAAKGSKFIITTRNKNIAMRVKTVEKIFDLTLMSNEDCWSLFCSHSKLDINSRSELVRFGKEISDRCAGLPLAVAVMGGLLQGNGNEAEWRAVLNDHSWISKKGSCEINSVLKMTYNSLPYCLKYCFAFCTLFGEDYKYQREVLIDLWMAAGLIKCGNHSHNRKAMKDLGGCYFNELVSRGLLSSLGNCYVMHDLIRDMGREICGNIYCMWENELGSWEKARHLMIHKSMISSIIQSLKLCDCKVLPLRTFMAEGGFYNIQKGLDNLFLKLRKLRVLRMTEFKVAKIPKSIGQMKQLRYLEISSFHEVKEIPFTIGNLTSLNTLCIEDCPRLAALPAELGCLGGLALLDIRDCPGLTLLPAELGNLNSLEVLRIWDCPRLTSIPMELGNLSNLATLRIWDCPGLTGLPPELGRLSSLTTLVIWKCSGLTGLPLELGSLSSLTTLAIQDCPRLAGLPSELVNLRRRLVYGNVQPRSNPS